jgi:hypothetical protein
MTQCALEGYTVVIHFCRKEYKGERIPIYSSRNITQRLLQYPWTKIHCGWRLQFQTY